MSQLSFSLGALFFKILDRFEILLGASSVFSISFSVPGVGTTLNCTGAGWVAMLRCFLVNFSEMGDGQCG